MSFFQLAEDRYSVRNFSDKPISDEQIEMIIDAGRMAPTAVNNQPQHIYILKSPEALEKLRSITKMAFNAPLVMFICHDVNESWKAEAFDDSFDAGEMDATITATFMMMEATELGIGSLWARGFNAKKIEEAFSIPDNLVLDCMLDFGYPAAESAPSERHFQKKDISEFIEAVL